MGGPQLDNYHQVNGQRGRFTRGDVLPLDDVPDAIRRKVWLDTDRTYRLASRRLIEIKSNQETKVKDADGSADFSSEPPAVYQEPPPPMGTVDSEWAKRVRKWSADVGKSSDVLYSSVSLSAQRISKYMVSTEGIAAAARARLCGPFHHGARQGYGRHGPGGAGGFSGGRSGASAIAGRD